MLQSLLNALFGCTHQRTTFPQTPGRKIAGHPAAGAVNKNGTYVVCLDCGKEFAYNWNEMRLGRQVTARAASTETQPMYR
jgi:hypothetical protein